MGKTRRAIVYGISKRRKMQIKRYLADSSAISKTQGYRSPEGGRYSPWGGPIRFGRSIEEQSFSIYSRESPQKTQYGNRVQPAWRFNGRPAPLARISKLNPPYQTRFI